ncbi:MAG: hypothetical protein AAF362_09025 [Pseudomonadota bacterium]
METVLAIIFSTVLTFIDRLFISGPYMGLAGIILSILAGIGGWYLAKFVASLIQKRLDTDGVVYSFWPWEIIFTVASALIFASLAYFKLFDLTKTDYSTADVVVHIILVLLAAFVVRMAAYSVVKLTD